MAQRYYAVKHQVYFRRRRFPKRFFAWLLLIGALAGGGVYEAFFSGFFAIDNVEIRGLVKIPASDLRALVLEHLDGSIFGRVPKNNMVLVSTENLEREIADRFPRLAHVAVQKKYPRRLAVEVSERQYAGVWCTAMQLPATEPHAQTASTTIPLTPSKCFLVDAEGVAYNEAAESNGVLQFRVVAARQGESRLGDAVIEPAVLEYLRRAKDALADRFGIRISHFEIRGLPDAAAYTGGGWRVLLDTSRPLDAALEALKKTLAAIDQNAVTIEYIDLRIEGRAYYKTIPL